MKNFIQPGDTLTITTPAGGAVSGDGVLVGALFGVAAFSAPENAPLEIVTEGVFELPKATGVAFSAGDKAFFDPAKKTIAAQASGLAWIGVVTQGAPGSAPAVRIRLNHMPIN